MRCLVAVPLTSPLECLLKADFYLPPPSALGRLLPFLTGSNRPIAANRKWWFPPFSRRSSLARLKSFRLMHSVDLSCKEVATEFSAWLGNTRLDRSDDQAYRLVL
jgi:hypothetical protein